LIESDAMILSLCAIDAMFDPVPWSFAETHVQRINAEWARMTEANPHLFDGQVLLQHDWRIEDGVYHARYLQTSYRNFMAWRSFGFPGSPMRNGFSMAALESRDGAFLLGRMGPHTAHAGKVYFASGTPDPGDIRNGKVDLVGSVLRELEEETGLSAADVTVSDQWTVVLDGPRAAFMRPVSINLVAEDARALMLERIRLLPEEELDDIVIVRSRRDIDPDCMPGFMVAYLKAQFAARSSD
jgi:8-oxo-dGTP pyrophosphatase MutT (NUDIX family)